MWIVSLRNRCPINIIVDLGGTEGLCAKAARWARCIQNIFLIRFRGIFHLNGFKLKNSYVCFLSVLHFSNIRDCLRPPLLPLERKMKSIKMRL